jgi:hypothetical protein
LVVAIEVDEDGDIGLPALGGGPVEADGLDAGEIEAFHRLADVMLDDPPQALIGECTGGNEAFGDTGAGAPAQYYAQFRVLLLHVC